MTTKEKMQILIDGGKLVGHFWLNKAYHVSLSDDGENLVDHKGRIVGFDILKDCDQIYSEPEDETLYEWAFKDSDGDTVCSGIFKTKKQAKRDFKSYSEYYILRKFEPLETFKNKEQE